jgi:hypothetical protein
MESGNYQGSFYVIEHIRRILHYLSIKDILNYLSINKTMYSIVMSNNIPDYSIDREIIIHSIYLIQKPKFLLKIFRR